MFSYDFTQIIPFWARRDFLDHVNRNIHHLGVFEVTLDSLKQPAERYTVQVTNEANRTYFSGPRWTNLVNDYVMEDGEKCVFFLDNDGTTYFHYKDPNNSDDSGGDSLDHDPRDDDIPADAVSEFVEME